MSTVLWGARRGDVQYGGIGWRRRNIPVGASVVEVSSSLQFGPWDVVEVLRARRPRDHRFPAARFRVVGIEPGRLGVELVR